MIAPSGSKAAIGPTSTRKPVFLAVLFQITWVPGFKQNSEPLFAPGILGVEEAELPVRFTFTVQGSVADPHVLLAVQSCSGCASLQAYLLFDCAMADAATTKGSANTAHRIAKHP